MKKTYIAHVQFEAVGITAFAENKRAARKIILAKLKKRHPKIDRNNFFID